MIIVLHMNSGVGFSIGKERNLVLLNILVLLELATLLVAVSLTNFSLAFIAAVIYVPPILWIQSSNNRSDSMLCLVL